MADQEKKELEIENLEATELEDEDLEDVSGGNTNCVCSVGKTGSSFSGSGGLE